MKKGALFSSLAWSILREAFGEFPHRVVQLPKPTLRRAVWRFKSLCLWHVFEVLFVGLIADGILGERRLLIFHHKRITLQPIENPGPARIFQKGLVPNT